MRFTEEVIPQLSLPADRNDLIIFDDDLPGFGIRLRRGGKRVWIAQYRVLGRQRRETLGDVRRLTLRAARMAAQQRFAQVALGGDPQGEKAAARAKAALTVGAVADRYLAAKKARVRENTYVADQRYLTQYIQSLRAMPLGSITRSIVAARLSSIVSEHGMTAAARARQSLSAFFSWAIREGLAESNPVMGTNNPGIHLRPRDRVLTEPELRSIWLACQEDDFGRIIRLLMLTGSRRDEIGGLRWSELEPSGVLHIPGSRTKNHHALRLPLPAPALLILKSISPREGRDLIFGGGRGAFSAWSYSLLAMNKRIAESDDGPIAGWRIHDIRRTVATGMGDLGIQPHIIEAVLNHRSGHRAGVAGIYNRAQYASQTAVALASWAQHLMSIVHPKRQLAVVHSAA